MALVRDRCICLRMIEYSETSQILLLFARENGLIRAIARGAHRTTKAGSSKFGGGIDLLDLADAVFTHDSQRELGTLTEWHLQDGHLELRRNLRAMYLAQYAAELVATLMEEHDPHPQLFDRLRLTLKDLTSPRGEESFLAFQLDLLRETGYLIELSACMSCGAAVANADPVFFSPRQGGLVCRNCQSIVHDRIRMPLALIRLMQSILRLPRDNGWPARFRATRHQTDPINGMLAEHVEHTLGRRLRMRRYVLGRG